jgi:hypothetical protein
LGMQWSSGGNRVVRLPKLGNGILDATVLDWMRLFFGAKLAQEQTVVRLFGTYLAALRPG